MEKYPDLQRQLRHDLARADCCDAKDAVIRKYKDRVKHRDDRAAPGKRKS